MASKRFVYIRLFLSKADGMSRFVYPSLSLFVQPSLCKEINNTLINCQERQMPPLKERDLSSPKRGWRHGIVRLHNVNNSFKMKWIKEFLKKPESLWYFIPKNIFLKVGGLPPI